MPLLKKSHFTLLEPSLDLEPNELVYQVRFTKEIFHDYQFKIPFEVDALPFSLFSSVWRRAYLNRINLYRQRIWRCEVSGKANLTYEEALVSEKQASEKVQQIPQELVAPALHIIQFSMLSLKDLADTIATKLQENLFIGAELHGRRRGDLSPCKVLKVLKEGTGKTKYEVAWLDRNKKVAETTVVNEDVLTWKKSPFSRKILKSFIRKSTYRSFPWVIHDKLAQKHRISSDPPQELQDKVFVQNGLVHNKRKKNDTEVEESGKHKKKKVEGKEADGSLEKNTKHKKKKVEGKEADGSLEKNTMKEDDQPEEELIKYPIDDLLVQPGADDPVFTDRPLPSRDFNVPMDCVGDLLMVWDFCSSYGKLLHLWPFSLENFENAICHKGSNLSLIVETHSALLGLLKRDNDEYFSPLHKRSRKITVTNWTDYLCDFLEMINIPDFSTQITTIKRGHYGLLDAQVKLGILRELINKALETDLLRAKLDEYIQERQVLGATRREEALEEGKKKREEKERLKAKAAANGVANGHLVDPVGNNLLLANGNHMGGQNEEIAKKKGEALSSQPNHALNKSKSSHSDTTAKNPRNKMNIDMEGNASDSVDLNKNESCHLDHKSKKTGNKKNMDLERKSANVIDVTRKEALMLLRDEKNDAAQRKNKDQRREYFEREMEKRALCTHPLGKDRDYNRYWWFKRDGRMFIESSDSKLWGYYCSKEELDLLMGSLNPKGERERSLHKQLEKFYSKLCSELRKRAKDLADKIALEEAVRRRSTRVRALPRENSANGFLTYVNKWKED